MKIFGITRNFVADSGHSITVVKADDEANALKKYNEWNHMNSTPIGTSIQEITEEITEIYRFDNPNYEG